MDGPLLEVRNLVRLRAPAVRSIWRNIRTPSSTSCWEQARATADKATRIKDYCEIAKIINHDAPWFWTFQNTYYAIAKPKLKGGAKLYSDVIDISESWLE